MSSLAAGALISVGLLLSPAGIPDGAGARDAATAVRPLAATAPILPPWNEALQAIVAELAKPPAFPGQRHPRPRPSPVRDFG